MLDFMRVAPGEKLRLQDGRIVEVLENVGDGMWVRARTVGDGVQADDAPEGDLVHCEEVVTVCRD